MSGILEMLRAAAMPAAAARAGWVHGKDVEHDKALAEAERNRQIARQQHMDTEEQHRYDVGQTRQASLDKQAGLLAQTRAELERAQAEQARSHGEYYRKGGARGFKGSGANGELTPKDRARYIQAMSRPVYNPDTGLMEQGVAPETAAKQFDEIVAGQKPKAPAMNQGGGVGAMRSRGAMGATMTPQAAKPDTATRTQGPIAQVRAAMTPSGTMATQVTPKVDSATLAKKHSWLFEP